MPFFLIKTPLRTAPGTTLKPGEICEMSAEQGKELVAAKAVVKVANPSKSSKPPKPDAGTAGTTGTTDETDTAGNT